MYTYIGYRIANRNKISFILLLVEDALLQELLEYIGNRMDREQSFVATKLHV